MGLTISNFQDIARTESEDSLLPRTKIVYSVAHTVQSRTEGTASKSKDKPTGNF